MASRTRTRLTLFFLTAGGILLFPGYGDPQRINYQPADIDPPPGYEIDSAKAYDPIRGYGWLYPIPTSPPANSPTPTPTSTPTCTPLPYSYGKDESCELPIPDNDAGGVISTLFIPDTITIGAMNIYVGINHPYIADLTVDVISPAGTSIRLHDQSGGGTSWIENWYEKGSAADGPGSPSDFIGESSYGEWVLLVADHSTLHDGSICKWEIEIDGTLLPSPTPSPTPTATPPPIYCSSASIGAVKGAGPMPLYTYDTLVPGDYTYDDIISRNPSPRSKDSWVIPAGNSVRYMTDIDIDADGINEIAVVKEPAAGTYELYIYAAPYEGDDSYWDAAARNPNPLARDFWAIPTGNVRAISAIHDIDDDGMNEIAVLKEDAGGDQNLYIYNAPVAGDLSSGDATARNPSPLARDAHRILEGNNTIALSCVSLDADPIEDAIATVRNEGGNHNIYLWNLPVPGDWSYWDADSRNPSPLARDLWTVPSGNDVAMISPVNSWGERLAVIKQTESDLNLYTYNVPAAGDWSYWDSISRNPSPMARDFWVIPGGNDTTAITGLNVMAQDYPLGAGILQPVDGSITNSQSIDVLGRVTKESFVELIVNSDSREEQYVTPFLQWTWTSLKDWEEGAGINVVTKSEPVRVQLEAFAEDFYHSEGTITLDLDVHETSRFTGVDINADLSASRRIGCRYRIADSFGGLLTAQWSSLHWVFPFDITNDNEGRWIRLEFTLKTDDISATPVLHSAFLKYTNLSPLFLFEDVAISEGPNNQIEVLATRCEETAGASVTIECDLVPPTVTITPPPDPIIGSIIEVSGTVSGAMGVSVNGKLGTIDDQDFSVAEYQLSPGPNTLTATAWDTAGNQATDEVMINYIDDLDYDGLTNDEELLGDDGIAGSGDETDPQVDDSDNDGLPDGWEVDHGLDPNDDGSVNPDNGANGDPDDDDISNSDEYAAGTDPTDPDTEDPSITITSPSQGVQIR